jgi:hypothetical protein
MWSLRRSHWEHAFDRMEEKDNFIGRLTKTAERIHSQHDYLRMQEDAKNAFLQNRREAKAAGLPFKEKLFRLKNDSAARKLFSFGYVPQVIFDIASETLDAIKKRHSDNPTYFLMENFARKEVMGQNSLLKLQEKGDNLDVICQRAMTNRALRSYHQLENMQADAYLKPKDKRRLEGAWTYQFMKQPQIMNSQTGIVSM